jgi:glycosyltransferase involved in cell wall biosynthesis
MPALNLASSCLGGSTPSNRADSWLDSNAIRELRTANRKPHVSPHICIISESTGPYGAIGRVAHAEVEALLGAGWRVSVVANRLDPSLEGRVTWRRLYVPPAGFAVKWVTGRRWIRRAMGDPSQYDLVHGHQPQIADLCHTYRCHFLTRVAHERNCLVNGRGMRRVIDRAQKAIVLRAEDRFYRNWNPSTWALFNSSLTRDHFVRLYGKPRYGEVMLYPAPPVREVTSAERSAARRKLLGEDRAGIVAGYLGGMHERKGYRRILDGLRAERDFFLLAAGWNSERLDLSNLAGGGRSLGVITDTDSFYAAIDVLLLPSVFEPFGYVAMEAAARGVPTIATPEVGATPHLVESGAGLEWTSFATPLDLGQLVRRAAKDGNMRSAALAWASQRSAEVHGRELVGTLTRRLGSGATQSLERSKVSA